MAFAQGLKVTDAPTISCLAGRFAIDPGARRFLVLSVLQRHADIEAAHALIGLVAALRRPSVARAEIRPTCRSMPRRVRVCSTR